VTLLGAPAVRVNIGYSGADAKLMLSPTDHPMLPSPYAVVFKLSVP